MASKRLRSAAAALLAKRGISPKTLSSLLTTTPPKDYDTPHQLIPKTGIVQQADLIYLPTDRKGGKAYKYGLVVVDVANSAFDVQPLTSRSAKAVTDGFKAIYRRKYLVFPQVMMSTDRGSEFQGSTRQYFENKGTVFKYGKPGRSRQQAFAEARNKVIGEVVARIQDNNEVLTGTKDTAWVDIVKALVQIGNEPQYLRPLYKPSNNASKPDVPVCTTKGKVNSCDLIPKGTQVRVILDRPTASDGSVLHGKRFRAGDRRYENIVRTVEQIVLKPKNPPLYIVSGIDGVAYTKAQLQVVKTEAKASKKAQTKFIVERIVGKRKRKGRVEYEIKWKGYPSSENTWEPRQQLLDDGFEDEINQFNRK